MLEETTNGTNLSRKAVLLMGEVMHLSNHLLPLHMAAQIQVISHTLLIILHELTNEKGSRSCFPASV
jgi:hypothetical protein